MRKLKLHNVSKPSLQPWKRNRAFYNPCPNSAVGKSALGGKDGLLCSANWPQLCRLLHSALKIHVCWGEKNPSTKGTPNHSSHFTHLVQVLCLGLKKSYTYACACACVCVCRRVPLKTSSESKLHTQFSSAFLINSGPWQILPHMHPWIQSSLHQLWMLRAWRYLFNQTSTVALLISRCHYFSSQTTSWHIIIFRDVCANTILCARWIITSNAR